MTTLRSVVTILIILFTSVSVFPQGAFLEKGQSGFGLGAAFSTNKDVSGFGGAASYSINGIFDLGVFVGSFSFEEKLAGYDLSAIAVSPFINVHIIKQDQNTPLSISLSGSYETDSYSSDALDILKWDLRGSYFSFGGSVYVNVPISITGYIQPSVGVSYTTGESEVKDNNGNKVTNKSNSTNFDIGFSFVFRTSPSMLFRLTPIVGFNKDNTTFAVGAGLVFSTN